MTRFLLLFVALLATASPVSTRQDELMEHWNRFAQDANAYVSGLNQGVVDVRMRKKVMREWESMVRCECW